MAQDFTSKQLNFCSDLTRTVVDLLNLNDKLLALFSNWNGNSYATGAPPTENNITDQVLSGTSFAYMTALQLNEAIGAIKSVTDTVSANRGYLEATRP